MREVTVTAKHFDLNGKTESTKTSRHQFGYRLDTVASVDYPYDNHSLSYSDTTPGQVKLTVLNSQKQTIAEYELVPDAEAQD